MIHGDIPPIAEPDEYSALAALAEEITRRLERGESVDPVEYQQAHPELAAPIRGLIPTLHTLVDLGRATGPGRGPHVRGQEKECP
jgi:hypothetical protein